VQFSTDRTEEFLSDSKFLLKVENQLLGELLHCFTFAIKGKSKFVDCLYLIRNVHEGRQPSSFTEWVLRSDWSSDIENSINGISLALHETSDLSLEQSRKTIIEIYKNIVNMSIVKYCQKKESVPFLAGVKRLLPVGLKKLLRQLSTLVMDERDMRLLQSKGHVFIMNSSLFVKV
jgi:hypothetical protein